MAQLQHSPLLIPFSSDDEDEEVANPALEAPDEVQVKPEPEEPLLRKAKAREGTPSYELHVYTEEELSRLKKKELVAQVGLLDGCFRLIFILASIDILFPEKLTTAKPNMSVLKEYRKREEEFLKRAKDLEQITALRDAEKQKYDGLRKQRLDEFMAGFSLISLKLKEMYQVCFMEVEHSLWITHGASDDHAWWQRRARIG